MSLIEVETMIADLNIHHENGIVKGILDQNHEC